VIGVKNYKNPAFSANSSKPLGKVLALTLSFGVYSWAKKRLGCIWISTFAV